jgi:selenide,water dikinase
MKNMEEKLFCKNGGCTAKLGAGALSKILGMLERRRDENLISGFENNEDAAVYKINDKIAFVQTLDFFPPMVEDPYIFGQIAAANALSNIYAMGGEVKTALNIVCFPEDGDLNVLGKILQGGNDKVIEAGGVLAGGHSICDDGIKYGLSATGLIEVDKVLKNSECAEGDVIILTKPLGTGIICTAARMNKADKKSYDEAVKSMTFLNKYAADILHKYNVHACTDVTGFGLLVHLSEMLGDKFSAEIYVDKIPIIENAIQYADDFYITGAGQKNRNHVEKDVELKNVNFGMQEVLFDPQTSGGFLISMPEESAKKALAEIEKLGLPCGIIGKITSKKDKKIYVK